MRGWGACGCLACISFRTSAEGGARPPEDRAWMAFPYCPSSTARLARLALVLLRSSGVVSFGVLRRRVPLVPFASISDQSSTKSPARHLLMRDLTRFRVSRQCIRPPLTGLAKMQRGSMKHFDHASWSDGTWQIESKASPNTPAQASLTPLGTCKRVGNFVLKWTQMMGGLEHWG